MSLPITNFTNKIQVTTSLFPEEPNIWSSSTNLFNVTTNINLTAGNNSSSVTVFESQLIIPLYVIIFLLSIVGNFMVLVTLARNRRMRTVTNVYLLNLVRLVLF